MTPNAGDAPADRAASWDWAPADAVADRALVAAMVELHRVVYAPPRDAGGFGFGAPFLEAVRAEIAELLGDADPARERIRWSGPPPAALTAGAPLTGAVALDARPGRAHPAYGDARLRFFAVRPDARGSGLGGALLTAALARAREIGARSVWLDTFAELDGARRLYRRAGFVLVHEEASTRYGPAVRAQRLRLEF